MSTCEYSKAMSCVRGPLFVLQIYTVDVNDPKDCGKKFRSNRDIGLVFWALILASSAYGYRKLAKQDTAGECLADDRNAV